MAKQITTTCELDRLTQGEFPSTGKKLDLIVDTLDLVRADIHNMRSRSSPTFRAAGIPSPRAGSRYGAN